MRFMISFVCFIVLLLALQSEAKYTNNQAFQCFAEKAIPFCSETFAECSAMEACKLQLQHFNQCSFDDSEQEKEHIFNGYCFRRWYERAIESKKVISCISGTCNLLYNSEIGAGELYQCIQSMLLDKEIQCGEECEREMQAKIGDKFYEETIRDLYLQEFENDEARKLANLVLEDCVKEKGSGKEMIYNEELLKESHRPQNKQVDSSQVQL